MEQWFPLIGEVGFPIVITMYLLLRIEQKIEALASSIGELNSSIMQFRILEK